MGTVQEAPVFGFPLNEAVFLYAEERLVRAFHAAEAAAAGMHIHSVSAYIAGAEAAARAHYESSLVIKKNHVEAAVIRDFIKKLFFGQIIAYGFVGPIALESRRVKVPRDKWELLRPNFQESSASAEGLVVSGILVIHSNEEDRWNRDEPAPETTSDDAPASAPKATAGAERRCREWIKNEVREGRTYKRTEALELAKKIIGPALSDRAFGRAWDVEAPASWKKPGRRRAPSK